MPPLVLIVLIDNHADVDDERDDNKISRSKIGQGIKSISPNTDINTGTRILELH